MQRQEFLSRWLEIIKKSSAVLVYKQDFIARLLAAVRNCATRHTYDPAWARALVETAGRSRTAGGVDLEIDLRDTAAKMIRYYWDQTFFFNLVQGSNPSRQPELIRRVRDLIGEYVKSRRPGGPVRFEDAGFNTLFREKLEDHIEAAAEILKNDVAARFLEKGRLPGEFVRYSRGQASLLLNQNAASALAENGPLVTEAIYCRWTQILEKYNNSPRLNRKVRVIDSPDLQDRPLTYYAKYLDLDNPDRLCFYCGQPVEGREPGISHLIPWSYLCSDDIWNLVYAHGSCKPAGAGPAPPEFFIARLEKRNLSLLEKLAGYVETDIVAGTLHDAVNRNLVRKCWICCRDA